MPISLACSYGTRTLLVGLASVLLSGCATELTFRRREALDYFVGKDRSSVIAALGQPAHVSQQNGMETLSYESHVQRWFPGDTALGRSSVGEPLGPWVEDARCSTIFRLQAGQVNGWALDGNDCGSVDFPTLEMTMSGALAEASTRGVNRVATFAHNPFTARSVVNHDEFYSN